MQKQANNRRRFVFAFYGVFEPDQWSDTLDLRSATVTQDDRGLKYAFIRTKEQRASEVELHLKRHDSEAPDSMKVKLTTIAGYDSIISFGKGEDLNKHAIYKTMMKYSKSPSCVEWNAKCAPSSSNRHQRRVPDIRNYQLGQGGSAIIDESSLDSTDSSSVNSGLVPLLEEQTEKIREEFRNYLEEQKLQNEQREQLLRDEFQKEREEQKLREEQREQRLRDEIKKELEEQFSRQKELVLAQETTIKEGNSRLRETMVEISGAQEVMIKEGNSCLQEKMDNVLDTQASMVSKEKENAYLRNDLDATKHDLEEERSKKRSNAGKLAAMTRKANKALAAQARMAADQLTTIERSAVITEVRHVQNMMDSVASHLGMSVETPFGDLNDKGAYESWLEPNGYNEHYQRYKENLETTYRKAKEKIMRDDLPPEFPEIAKIRLFMYGLAVLFKSMDDAVNLDNSPAKQRLDLAIYSCNICSFDAFDEVQDILETHVKFYSDRLSIEYVKDTAVYPTIKGDAFEVPAVRFYFYFVFECFDQFPPQMKSWKLEPIIHSQRFKDYWKHFQTKHPGYSLQTCWRYFTFQHMVGADARQSSEVHTDSVEWFENGKFYSRETLQKMEEKYLRKISVLKQQLQDTSDFDAAAEEVIHRATKTRQNSRSTRDGKIRNHY